MKPAGWRHVHELRISKHFFIPILFNDYVPILRMIILSPFNSLELISIGREKSVEGMSYNHHFVVVLCICTWRRCIQVKVLEKGHEVQFALLNFRLGVWSEESVEFCKNSQPITAWIYIIGCRVQVNCDRPRSLDYINDRALTANSNFNTFSTG